MQVSIELCTEQLWALLGNQTQREERRKDPVPTKTERWWLRPPALTSIHPAQLEVISYLPKVFSFRSCDSKNTAAALWMHMPHLFNVSLPLDLFNCPINFWVNNKKPTSIRKLKIKPDIYAQGSENSRWQPHLIYRFNQWWLTNWCSHGI